MGIVKERHEAERLPSRALGHHLHAIVEQRGIATEPVHDKADDHGVVGGIDHGLGADEACDHAAAVDVAHDHHRHARCPREAHVGDVRRPEIHFRRRARTFDQDEIGLAGEAFEAFEDSTQKFRLHGLVFTGLGVADDAALHDDLRADVALGFQQHRVHVNAGRYARGACLQRLGAADLAAVRRDGGVVRHVLRLERSDPEPTPREGAGECRDKQRLADVRARALDHDCASAH